MAEAARRLEVSPEAVRKRIKRGTIEHDQDESGLTHVYVEVVNLGANPSPAEVINPHLERLVQNQEQEIEHLRGQLDAERAAHAEAREARRRADHIIAALTERIPELEAPPRSPEEATEAPGSASEVNLGTSREEAAAEHTEPQSSSPGTGSGHPRRSWWRRMAGWVRE